jgi:ribosomal protein S18 acetylase RimI-like enzyme
MELRGAATGDVSAVLRLWRDAEAAPTHTDDPESIEQLIAHDPGALILAETDGRIVGSVIAAWDGWRGSIYRLAVVPEERRHGLGRRLVEAAEARLSGLGAGRLQAIVIESDVPATSFWRASGWEEQTGRLRFVRS